jgi:NAD(P)-dependent dehydrogenase (short-subunit alcohol dehydrogenase family)
VSGLSQAGNFDGVVLITGGSKGIGEGCARAFAAAGARVAIADVDEPAGRALAESLTADGPGECQYFPCDVRDEAQLKRTIDAAAGRFGRLDCLINNAGWHPPSKPIDDFSTDEFRDLLQLNLVAVFAGCKFALPYLRQARGSIINISSLVAVMGQEHATTYCATKGGVSAFTRGLAIDEARHGVRVNAVLPGNVLTPMRVASVAASPDPQALNDTIESWQWTGRSATTGEIGQVCLFLASDAASFVTGIELNATGGAELGYGIKMPSKPG